jgi:hypothetical protein
MRASLRGGLAEMAVTDAVCEESKVDFKTFTLLIGYCVVSAFNVTAPIQDPKPTPIE